MRSLLAVLVVLVGCAGSPFSPSSVGVRFEPRPSDGAPEAARYVHRDSGVGFVMPVRADAGDREEDDAGFERLVVSASHERATYRVVVFRPIDGTDVDPERAIARLADGLAQGQTVLRDQPTTIGDHPARRLAITRATREGGEVAILVTADAHALVMMELVAPAGEGTAALADPFFASLELGCDR